MSEWEEARESRTVKIKSISRIIPGYDYSGEESAHHTDDEFCRVMIENLRLAKGDMFNILNTAFELHKDLLLKDFEAVRDEIDVFSDEIKARVFRWDRTKSRKWLGMLVDRDYHILNSVNTLLKDIKALHKDLLSSTKRVEDMRKLDRETAKIKKALDEIVFIYKEREALCNIRDATIQEEFDEICSRIRKGF